MLCRKYIYIRLEAEKHVAKLTIYKTVCTTIIEIRGFFSILVFAVRQAIISVN